MKRQKIVSLSPLILIVCLNASCSPRDSGYRTETIDGVSVRTYGDQHTVLENPFRIEEKQVFGADQSEDTYLLTGARPAAVADDGTLYLVDVRESRIYLFSPTGTLLASFGNRGSGPGEFNGVDRVIADGPYLYIPDLMAGRLTVMTREGAFVQQYRPGSMEALGGNICLYGDRESRKFLTFGMSYEQLDQPKFRLSCWTGTLEQYKVLMELPITEMSVFMRGVANVPFTNKIAVTALRTDLPFAWYIGDQCRIDFLDPVSLNRWASIIPHERVSITSEMRRRRLERYEGRSDPEEIRAIRFPDYLPHFQYLFWDTSGRLWAWEYADPYADREWVRHYVFSISGEWLFTQDLPVDALQPPIVSLCTEDGYYISSRLEDGTPVVRYFGFVRRE